MMNKILLVNPDASFMTKVLISGIEKAGMTAVQAPLEAGSIRREAEAANVILLFADEALSRQPEAAADLGALCAGSARRLFVIGTDEELALAEGLGLQGRIDRKFARPMAFKSILEAITETSKDKLTARLSDAGLDVESGLHYTGGDPDLYLEVVRSFIGNASEHSACIRDDYGRQDWQGYQTHVHALKSSARTIGADSLSALALGQENAARERHMEQILIGYEPLMSSYAQTVASLRAALGLAAEPLAAVKDASTAAGENEEETEATAWVLVVDDNPDILKMARHILASDHIRPSCVSSGDEALRFLASCDGLPDLILLDIHMVGMDGYETLARLRQEPRLHKLPVIFLTADDDTKAEIRGLDAGAMDFIRKPFVPKVLLTRVHHIIELTRLQNDLASQVEEKTRAIIEQQERISRINMQVVHALAGAIDAKDAYTNGHSKRVAEYAREIARRFGYSAESQQNIYMIGLLHDVGKIGIPDHIIGKPARLSDAEYELVKAHPAIGDKILQNIPEFPELAVGARWHHERYDGKGYPDGISGADIPEAARIIAVADSYDAMASRRSYRDVLPQEVIRSEIENGKQTQFDPVFAEIMLQIIAEDTEYKMREH